MLDEATKHVREAIMLGRTDILKKLLEEVKSSLSKGKTFLFVLEYKYKCVKTGQCCNLSDFDARWLKNLDFVYKSFV